MPQTKSLSDTGSCEICICVLAVMVLGSSSALAAGDVVAGKQVFATTCGACHSTEPGANKIGPSLARIFGSKSGAVPGYDFSAALKAANITWDETALDKFLQNPAADVHGTTMFISVPNARIARTSLHISKL